MELGLQTKPDAEKRLGHYTGTLGKLSRGSSWSHRVPVASSCVNRNLRDLTLPNDGGLGNEMVAMSIRY